MPITQVAAPDGSMIKVDHPEGATDEEIIGFASQNYTGVADDGNNSANSNSGVPIPTDGVEAPGTLDKIQEFFTGSQRMTPEMEQLQEIGDAPELNELSMDSFKTALGLLTTGDTKKIKEIILAQTPDAKFRKDEKGNEIADLPSGSFAINKPGASPQDLIKTAFTLAAFSPAGKLATLPANVGARVGAGVLASGATEGALQAATSAAGADLSQGEVIKDVAIAGALGGGGQVLGEGIGALGRAAKGKIAPQQQQVIAAGESAGVPVMTTDVNPPKGIIGGLLRQAGERIPIFGTGGKRASQQEARQRATEEFVRLAPKSTPSDIIASLKAQTSKVKKAAGSRIESYIGRMDEGGVVNVSNVTTKIDDITESLTRKGVIKDPATVDQLAAIKQTLEEAPQSFGMLRENRTAIREFVDNIDPAVRKQLPTKTKAQLDGLYREITKSLDDFVLGKEGATSLSRYKKADLVYANEAQKLTKTRIKNVLDKGDMTPEAVETLLFSRKPSEVKLLHDSLSADGRAAARSSIIGRALDKAGGVDDLNPTIFTNEMKRLRESVGVFFKGEEGQRVKGLVKLLEATKQAQNAKVVTPTGQSLQVLMGAGAGAGSAGTIGVLPTLAIVATSGGAARVYESKPMRDLLLTLANTPRGSTAFDKAVLKFTPDVLAVLQTANREAQ